MMLLILPQGRFDLDLAVRAVANSGECIQHNILFQLIHLVPHFEQGLIIAKHLDSADNYSILIVNRCGADQNRYAMSFGMMQIYLSLARQPILNSCQERQPSSQRCCPASVM